MESSEATLQDPQGGKPINQHFSSTPEVPVAPLRQRIGFAALALLLWIFSTALIVIVPAVFLLPYLASKGVPLNDGPAIADFAKNDPSALLLQLGAIIPAHLLTILVIWLVITQGKKYKFLQTFGMGRGGVRWWHYVAILVGFFVCAALVQSLLPEQENDMLRILRSSRSAAYLVAFVATFSAPFVEELVYRGVLYSTFKRAFGIPVSFVAVTLLFALVHVPQYYPSYSTILLLTLLSLTLTGLRVASDNLLPCIILHTIFNGLQSIVIVLEPLINSQKPEQAATIIRHM